MGLSYRSRRSEGHALRFVAQNPEPYAFALTCTGVEPLVEMEGPWSDADGVSEEESSVLLDSTGYY